MPKIILRWTCWCLLVIFPAALVAADTENVAMLSGSGTVRVNGVVVPGSSAVYAGDKVVTDKSSSVTLTSKGRSILLPEDSSLAYNGRQVRLEEGRVLITARPGTEAQLGNLTVSSARGFAKFQMRSSGSTMVLAALTGSLNVTDGVHRIALPGGQTMTAAALTQGGAIAVGAGAGTPAPVGTAAISGWAIAGGGAAAAGGTLGGLAAAGVIGGSPASPSQP